jgi:iron complex transport system substrate-binding protein
MQKTKNKHTTLQRQYCVLIFLIMTLLLSCKPAKTERNHAFKKESVVLSDAIGFSIDSIGQQYLLLSIMNPDDTSEVLAEFRLFPRDYKLPLKENEIKVPCERIICLSSTQLAYFFELENIAPIVAINSSRHLFNEPFKLRINAGEVKQVGKEGKFNVELIASLNPDLIFVSPFKAGGYDAIRNLGIPLVPMAAYKESTPLGRAEWIKMIAPFVGMEAEADSIFNQTKTEYEHLTALTKNVENRPTILSGKMTSGAWYVAGGASFFAYLFRDAGADYVIKDDKKGAYPMDFEKLYNLSHDADYWRLLTSSDAGFGYDALKAEDERYTFFDAYQKKKIILCNLRQVPYREQSAVKPQVLLADYISHIHPELLPGYKPVFWVEME